VQQRQWLVAATATRSVSSVLQKLAPVNPMLRAMERPSSAASQEPQGSARIERLPAFGCRLPVSYEASGTGEETGS